MAGCRSWRDEARLGRDEVEVRRRQVDGDGARAARQHDAMQGRRDADQRLGHREVHQPDCRIAQERCDVSFPASITNAASRSPASSAWRVTGVGSVCQFWA